MLNRLKGHYDTHINNSLKDQILPIEYRYNHNNVPRINNYYRADIKEINMI